MRMGWEHGSLNLPLQAPQLSTTNARSFADRPDLEEWRAQGQPATCWAGAPAPLGCRCCRRFCLQNGVIWHMTLVAQRPQWTCSTLYTYIMQLRAFLKWALDAYEATWKQGTACKAQHITTSCVSLKRLEQEPVCLLTHLRRRLWTQTLLQTLVAVVNGQT